MTTLKRAQTLFLDAIRHPTSVKDFLAESGEGTRHLFDATFSGSLAFPPEERVQVYAEAYFYRLFDVLAEMFPLVLASLGNARFHNVVTDYLLAHPSRNPDLHRLGDAFAGFLLERSVGTVALVDPALVDAALVDVASVEAALTFAIDAPDATPCHIDDLVHVAPADWPSLWFRLVPSATLLETQFDVVPLQVAHKQGKPLPTPTRGPGHTVVWRRRFQPFFRSLGESEARFLRALGPGCTFETLCGLADEQGLTPEQIVGSLRTWLGEELLTRSVSVQF